MKKEELFRELSDVFQSLIPLEGKKPIEKDWQRYCENTRLFDADDFKNRNAGIPCGPANGIIVMDVDNEDKFEKICQKNGWELPETRMHLTGRELPHYLYQYPKNGNRYGNRSFKKDGFDIKGLGGQVVGPGSIHPETGRPYKVTSDVPIVPAPPWLLEIALNEEKTQQPDTLNGEPINLDSLPIAYPIKNLIKNGNPQGQRSEAIASVISALIRARVPDSTIFQIFDTYPIGEKYHEKGHSKAKWLQDEISRARNFTNKNDQKQQIEIVSLESIANAEISDNPVIEGLLGEKESLIISGPSGIGKSLMGDYKALALGNPPTNGLWGLFKIPREIKTLIVQSENGFNATNRRLNKLFNACPEMRAGAKNVFTFKVGDDCRLVGSLTDKDFQKLLIDSLISIDAGNLILDPLISYHSEDENDNAAMRRSLDCLSMVCDKANATAILFHHYNRQNLTRGASSIRDWASNMLLMDFEKKVGDSVILKITHDKARNYEQQPDFYLERTPDLQFLRCEKPGKQLEKINAVVTALVKMGGRVESQAAFKKAIMVELNCSERTARRAIDQALEIRKIIIKPGKGKACSYVLSEEEFCEF